VGAGLVEGGGGVDDAAAEADGVDSDVVGAGAERTRVGSGTDGDGEGATGDLVGDGPEVG
jgi:hypothetical protein